LLAAVHINAVKLGTNYWWETQIAVKLYGSLMLSTSAGDGNGSASRLIPPAWLDGQLELMRCWVRKVSLVIRWPGYGLK
jgi:hypothetical protein